MNTVDVLVLVVLLLNGVIGAFRGFVWQAFRIGSLALGLWLGNRFAGVVADGPLTHLQALDGTGRKVVAYVGILLLAYGVMHLIGYWIRGLIDKARLTSADRSLGFLLGAMKGCVFVTLAFQVILIFFPFLPNEAIVQLRGGANDAPPASQAFALHRKILAHQISNLMPEEMGDDVRKGLEEAKR